MMKSGRADPFAGNDLDLSDFKTTPAARPKIPAAAIREVSEEHRFPSRAGNHSPSPPAKPRRRRTERNMQMNLKMTSVYKTRFEALADKLGLGLAETFEKAVEALEAAQPTGR